MRTAFPSMLLILQFGTHDKRQNNVTKPLHANNYLGSSLTKHTGQLSNLQLLNLQLLNSVTCSSYSKKFEATGHL